MVNTPGWVQPGQKPWPLQPQITLEKVQRLVSQTRRRWRLKDDWPTVLREPAEPGDDWGVTLPPEATFWNVLTWAQLPIAGPNNTSGGNIGGYLLEDSYLPEVKRRLEKVGAIIRIRDCLAMSFALDYTHEDGPKSPYTDLYQTLVATDPGQGTSVDERMRHAHRMVNQLEAFVRRMNCYEAAQIVTAVPSKNPAADFHLPVWLADQLSERLNMERGADKVKTLRLRLSMRNTGAPDRLEHLKGTIEVDSAAFNDKIVLIVDDVYQSGTSMNYLAYLLQQAGARAMFGLSCVKTLTNTDAVE